MNRLSRVVPAGILVITACLYLAGARLTTAGAQTAPTQAQSGQAKIIDDFGARVTHYLELRKDTAGTPPRPTTSTDKIVSSEQQMAAKIRSARDKATQGEIFTPEIAAYFRQQIATTLHGPGGKRIRASLKHAEPVKPMALQVNQTYPPGIPLQSTPPTLLANLPLLPKDLAYRIVGRNLVLHDIAANLIVDFVPDAIPTS